MPVYRAKDLVKGYTLDQDGNKVAIPDAEMAEVAVTITDVRDELRDWPALNEISRYELSDNEYATCILNAVAEFNAHGPMFTQFGVKDFPDRELLNAMATANALQRLHRWHERQQWSASDAGLQIPLHEAWQGLMQDSRDEERRNDQRMNELKQRLNIAAGWGDGVGSPLGYGYP